THDAKRGEDARARLNTLSELGEDWELRVKRWFTLNRSRRHTLAELTAPTLADEYLIYQTVLGAWPPHWDSTGPLAEEDVRAFRERLKGAVMKSLREAKVVTSWHSPNVDYEAGCLDFIDRILDCGRPNPFLEDFRGFATRAAFFGMLNSLS